MQFLKLQIVATLITVLVHYNTVFSNHDHTFTFICQGWGSVTNVPAYPNSEAKEPYYEVTCKYTQASVFRGGVEQQKI